MREGGALAELTQGAGTMEPMLPTPADNGMRLAAVLPNVLGSLAAGLGNGSVELLREASGVEHDRVSMLPEVQRLLPAVRAMVVIVVDGLGHANLKASLGHARTLGSLQSRRIETVIPSTTGAALTTITTGRLPGTHGLVGYKIRHPELGIVSTLKEWSGIADPRGWQRAVPLFELARNAGIEPYAIGRPAHATGGLTEAILRGTEYLGGQTIDDRFTLAAQVLRSQSSQLLYLYVDELDKVAHADGWQSPAWTRRLEQLDRALDSFLLRLPDDVGVVVLADHGVIDVPAGNRILLDDVVDVRRYAAVGGEPRMRSIYLRDTEAQEAHVQELQHVLGKRAWVGTREEAIAADWFGTMNSEVADRLGDVLVAARGFNAFMLRADGPAALAMVGQHGGLSDEERGVPLLLGGALHGTSFATAVQRLASLHVRGHERGEL